MRWWRVGRPALVRQAHRAGALVSACTFFVPLWGAFSAPVPTTFKIFLAALLLFGAGAPEVGLLLLCGFVPLGAAVGALWGLPWGGTQVIGAGVFALLSGWFARLFFNRDAQTPALHGPLTGLAAIVIASGLVVSASIDTGQLQLAGVGRIWMTALGGYLQFEQPFVPLYSALHLLAGLALVSVSAALAAASLSFRQQMIRILALGVGAAAALNIVRFAQIVTATGTPLSSAQYYLRWLRINTQYGDVNAASSVFAMMLLICVGLLCSNRRLVRAGWVVCATVTAAALWLAGSRTAIGAALLSATAALAWIFIRGRWTGSRARLFALLSGLTAVALLVLVAAFVVLQSDRFAGNADPSTAWSIRAELLARGMRMFSEHPVFGIGIGSFFAQSAKYSTPGSFGPENSHNNFMQIAAELGAGGLLMYLWLLAVAFRQLLRTARSDESHAGTWLAAALCAYLLSSLAGHPLIVWESALPFWILLGAGAANHSTDRPRRAHHWIAASAVAFTLASVPFRLPDPSANMATAKTQWFTDGELRYRQVGESDAIHVARPATAVIIPLRLSAADPARPYADAAIFVDGVQINRVVVLAERWTRVRVAFPNQPGYADRRIELRLERHAPGTVMLVGRIEPVN